jgi:hypothetical protein
MSPKWLEGEVSRIAIRESHITQTDGQLVIVPSSILFKNPVTIRADSDLRRITVICGVAYDVDLDTAVTVVASTATSIGVALVLALFLLASGDLFYVKLVQAFPMMREKKRALATVYGIERRVVQGRLPVSTNMPSTTNSETTRLTVEAPSSV